MAIAKNMKELEKLINKKINNALKNEVAKVARNTMKEQVIEEVYDRYKPKEYERTGGLYQDKNIKTTMEDDNTLTIENIRRDEDTGRLVAPIVEYGVGYEWEDSKIYNMQPYPRPFVAKTAKELEEKGLAKKAMKDGLKRQGLDVE